ncbi:NAD-dependent epimerase/dehydratase family protein [Amycolatopsis sp. cg5]|uniref:NAD-dependent epimerase/dehydratase family protein n=1 Tax=Amycolatopsis sp. cg5 TaxID=3238802 RepID=UPI003523FE18
MKTPVLVTGGAGFIGAHLVTYLADKGFRVFVADKAEPVSPDARAEWLRLDVTDFQWCQEIVRAVRPRVVFHLAASSTIDAAFGDPHGSLHTNVSGTLHMLEAVRGAGPARFVLSSTDKVYGELAGEAYRENSPLAARGVYDVGKLAADGLVRLYGDELGMPVSVLRLCNVYGPGDVATGSRIVPRSLARLFDPAGPEPPVVYEDSMTHSRDYVYVTDVARALASIAFDARSAGQVFNMAPSAHRTTLELVAELIERAALACEPFDRDRAEAIRRNGYRIARGAGPARALRRQHCDAAKLRSIVGFRNEVPLSAGLDRTIASYVRELRESVSLEYGGLS